MKKITIIILSASTIIATIIAIAASSSTSEPHLDQQKKQISKISRTLILDAIKPLTPKPTSKFTPAAYTATQQPDGTWTTTGSITYTDHHRTTHTKPYLITYTENLKLKTYAFSGTIKN